MDWLTPIDLYCERLAPGLFNEPLNALSNLAFLAAAIVATRTAVRAPAGRRDGFLWILILLVYLIFAGSTAFHTFANVWSRLADTLPIAAFIYTFFLFAMRRFAGLPWPWSIAATVLFLGASYVFGAALPANALNGSVSYLPAFFGLVGLGVYLAVRRFPAGRWLIAAAAVFLLSLMFRTIDQTVCTLLPTGTHFVWHVLNAAVLFLALSSAIRYGNGLAKPRASA